MLFALQNIIEQKNLKVVSLELEKILKRKIYVKYYYNICFCVCLEKFFKSPVCPSVAIVVENNPQLSSPAPPCNGREKGENEREKWRERNGEKEKERMKWKGRMREREKKEKERDNEERKRRERRRIIPLKVFALLYWQEQIISPFGQN